jgi:hypothetical protein
MHGNAGGTAAAWDGLDALYAFRLVVKRRRVVDDDHGAVPCTCALCAGTDSKGVMCCALIQQLRLLRMPRSMDNRSRRNREAKLIPNGGRKRKAVVASVTEYLHGLKHDLHIGGETCKSTHRPLAALLMKCKASVNLLGLGAAEASNYEFTAKFIRFMFPEVLQVR